MISRNETKDKGASMTKQTNKQTTKYLFFSAILAGVGLLLTGSLFASNKVIYGDDDRLDVFESRNKKYIKLSKSTAAMIPNHKIESLNAYEVTLGGKTLADGGKCSTENFASQPTTANCSGFLVDKNKIVTAGHCIKDMDDCKESSWVFDYKVSYSSQSKVIVSKKKVFKCKKIISQSLDESTKNDYALIELTEAVTDREPLKFRKSGKAKVGDKLVVIGHPSGLPTKIAAGAKVRKVGKIFFTANLDTYGGNSGSAVFNATTGVVEGILVRGDQDYKWDFNQGCMVSNQISDSSGRGEDVTLITNIKELKKIGQTISRPKPPVQTRDDLPYWLRRWLGLI
jgi:V8-like Glu-specific endopeptidase